MNETNDQRFFLPVAGGILIVFLLAFHVGADYHKNRQGIANRCEALSAGSGEIAVFRDPYPVGIRVIKCP